MAAAQQQKTDIRTRREIITPEKAQNLLAMNTSNRTLGTKRVNELALAIKNGHWKFNGASIVVMENGQLGDGQHRLAAVVVAGVPIETNVTYGVTEDAFPTIDTGRSRSASDLAGLAGYSNTNASTAAGGLLWRILQHAAWNESVSPELALTTLQRYTALSYWAAKYQSSRELRALVPGSAFVTACTYLDQVANRPDLAAELFDKMSTGLNLVDGDPISALRNRFLTHKETGRGSGHGAKAAWPLLVKCINLMESGAKAPKRFNTFGTGVTAIPQQPDKLASHMVGMHDDLAFRDFPSNTAGSSLNSSHVMKLGATQVPAHANNSKKIAKAKAKAE